MRSSSAFRLLTAVTEIHVSTGGLNFNGMKSINRPFLLSDDNAATFWSNILIDPASVCVIHMTNFVMQNIAIIGQYWLCRLFVLELNNNCSLCFTLMKFLTVIVEQILLLRINIYSLNSTLQDISLSKVEYEDCNCLISLVNRLIFWLILILNTGH